MTSILDEKNDENIILLIKNKSHEEGATQTENFKKALSLASQIQPIY